MKKFIAGVVGAMLMMSAGLFFWIGAQGQGNEIPEAPPPPELNKLEKLPLPADDAPVIGMPPPKPPRAHKASREEKRFNRYDRNRDEVITRLELMSSRTKPFKKLDKDGDNLLTFEEWAATTSLRFSEADSNDDRSLSRIEFRRTRPKRTAPRCRCKRTKF